MSGTERQALDPLHSDDPKRVGPYTLVGRVGSGGMGAVYAASDPAGGHLAVKVIHSEYAADPEFRARFAREVELVRRVSGPCVPAFRGADPEGATPWLATEYIPGSTLREHVQRAGPLPRGMLLALASGVAEALRAIHAAGIVHRDLKPGNVILAPDAPKVLDFGIARAVEETALTKSGAVIGTPGWISPEQYRGAAPDAAADIFTWGGLVAFAATGRNPFGTGTPDILAYRVLQEEADLDGLPGELRAIVTAALSKDPLLRPSAAEAVRTVDTLWRGTAADMEGQEAATAVTELLGAEWTGIEAPPPEPPPRRRRRGPLVAAALGAFLALAGIALAFAFFATPLFDGESPDGDPGGDPPDSEAAEGNPGGGDGEPQPEDSGDAGQEPVELPPEAVDHAESADGSATLVEAADDGSAEFRMALGFGGDHGADTYVHFTEAERAAEGVTLGAGANWGGMVNAVALTADNFVVLAGGEEFPASGEFSFAPTGMNGPYGLDAEPYPIALTFPDAPDRGLLVFRDANSTRAEELPPAGVCYEVDRGFHTDYEECV